MNECSSSRYSQNPHPGLAKNLERPLRVVHAGVYMYGGGAEHWLKSVAENLSPSVKIEKSLILGRKFYDGKFANRMPFPVKIVTERALAKNLRFADVLFYWGPVPVNKCLDNLSASERPSLVVFGAHSAHSRASLDLGSTYIDHVICVGHHIQRRVTPDFPSSIIHPVADEAHTFTSLDKITARQKLGYSPDDFVIGFVGSLVHNKRPRALLEALSFLPAKFKALLIGSGAELSTLKKFATRKTSSRAKFVKVESGIGDYYRAMDAVCVPSKTEGFSLVPLEALKNGIPLLVTPHGDIPIFFRHLENAWMLDDSNLTNSIVEGIRYVESNALGRIKMVTGGNNLSRDFGTIKQHSIKLASILLRLWEEQN
jgi:glycosyltransferase involved in cell wall biosynthesis